MRRDDGTNEAMKRAALTFGLISGGLSVALMLATIPFIGSIDYGKADLLGYTSIGLSALLVFFGVRSYREHAGAGRLTFGRGVAVGLLITLVSSLCYVAAFELVYFALVPGLGDKYAACMVERARASGASAERILEAAKQARQFKQMFDDPLVNVGLTFAGPFLIGLVVSPVSAAILRKSERR